MLRPKVYSVLPTHYRLRHPPGRKTAMSVSEIETAFAERLDKFGDLGATVKFDFGDDRLWIDGTQKPAVMSHEDKDAECTLSITPENLVAIQQGKLDATMAFMTGKLKVKGNTGIAMKLSSVMK
jgi:putative sterol carrier protein